MKKVLLYAGAALAMAACSFSPSNDYTVEMNTSALNEGMTVYLVDYDDNETKLDSAVVVDGKASFDGKIDEARFVRVVIDGKRKAMFILEPGTIVVDSLGKASGSSLNDAFEKFNVQSDSLRKEYMNVSKDTANNAQAEAIVKAYNELDSITQAENQGNPIGYFLFIQKAYTYQPAKLDSALAADTALLKYKRVQKLVEGFKRKQATSAGNKFTDFEITYNGNSQRLSDYVGHGNYVIVDFWASWCGPCMREAKNLKKIYEKWNGKGLEIVGVAVWDEPKNTEDAIEKEKLVWKHIINGQNIPTDLYGINGIPCIVVIDPEGMIIARDVRGEELQKLIDEKLTESKK